ncbi:calbindin-32-like isoform X1 [Tubulanus polymorphus]|uniref:calbindin-32-like isoform X1 n=1 Tax=Tubulanus polymorphus TaxID=672921 RepID=UPI003DA5491E
MATTKEEDGSRGNFLRQFRDSNTKQLKQVTAQQFQEVWNHYDTDGNGYIEGSELDNFLREFVSSVTSTEVGPETISDAALVELREAFMDAFDDNQDNRIEIGELAQILPTEENFLLLFRRDNPLESSVEFMRVWRQFDKDNSGYIDADELKDFLKYLIKQTAPVAQPTEETIITYTDTMLQLFDQNKDGKLQLSEMSKLLPVKENFLCRPIFKRLFQGSTLSPENASKINSYDIDRVFSLYDRDKNGIIDDDELQGFLKDLLELAQEDYDEDDLKYFRKEILENWDVNHDGKICKEELKMVLLQQGKIACGENE